MSNVSSLVSPQISSTLDKIVPPQAFGNQLVDVAKQKIVSTSLNKLDQLQDELQDIIKRKIDLEVKHKRNLNKLEEQYQPKPPKTPVLTEAEYNTAVEAENISYNAEKLALQKEEDNKSKQIQSVTKDPESKQKAKKKRVKTKVQRAKTKTKAEKRKAAVALLKNIAKSLGPLMLFTTTIAVSKLALQNGKLQDLVNETNAIIEAAQTSEELEQARVTRNSAYNTLNSNESTYVSLQNTLITIQLIITVARLLIPLLYLLPVPPLPLINQLNDKIDLLSFVLLMVIGVLEPVISELQDLKSQLREVDNRLDLETLNSDSLLLLSNTLNDVKFSINETYKGFQLVIKEDNDPKTIVRDVKRHYAVAINKQGAEVIKSQYSYTLEPNILIEQLKVIIDQQNLQG